MKLLQAIVPGCDKVTGKALMLDEIINYVQSLQNQVEFLSMKLASVNPMLYDFGVDLDAFMLKPDENMSSMELPIIPSIQQCSLHGGAATFAPAANDSYHLLSKFFIKGWWSVVVVMVVVVVVVDGGWWYLHNRSLILYGL